MQIPAVPSWADTDVGSYLDRLRDQRGLSPHTLDAYRRDLAQFFDYCHRTGKRGIAEPHRQTARRYLAFLDTLGYSRTTKSRKASAIRTFYTDAATRGRVSANPFDGVSTPKRDKPLPHAIPVGAMKTAIESIDTDSPVGLRDRAIVETLYATGLRISELASLTIHDAGGEIIQIKGKGGKFRTVPLGRPAQRAIERYLTHGRPSLHGGARMPTMP